MQEECDKCRRIANLNLITVLRVKLAARERALSYNKAPTELLAESLFTRSLGYSNNAFTPCNDRLYGSKNSNKKISFESHQK